MKPFRFGVQSYNAESPKEWRDKVKKAEDLGYSAFHLADHLLGPGPALQKCNHPVQSLAAVPAMAVAAEATSTIKIGCRVFCIDYRPAAVLIKEAATLDFFSDGRLEFGLGAGWLAAEYEALGIPMDPAGERVTRMEEYVKAAKVAFAGGEVHFDGKYVHLHDYESLPKPANPKGVQFMIGGGSKRVLTIAGREANIVSFNFDNSSGKIGPSGAQSSTAELTEQKAAWVKAGAESVGRKVEDLEFEIGAYFTVVTPDADAMNANFAKMFGITVEQMQDHPHAYIGTVDQICEIIQERRKKYGISYFTVSEGNLDAFAPVVARLTGK
jgi:probable F420-dependent oxidoreductase